MRRIVTSGLGKHVLLWRTFRNGLLCAEEEEEEEERYKIDRKTNI